MRLNYGSSVGNRKLLMHCVAGAKWKVSPFCQETVFNDFEKKCRWPLRGNSVFNRGMRSLQGEKDFFHRLVGAKTKAAPLSEDEACRLFVFVCSHKLVLPLGLCCKKKKKKVFLLSHVNEKNVFCGGNNICWISTKTTIIPRAEPPAKHIYLRKIW